MSGKQTKANWEQPLGMGQFCNCQGMQTLDLAAKAVAWYCLTGSQTKMPGVFILKGHKACKELGISQDDWNFYLELIVQELGWRWDAERELLWITDFFQWAKVGKRELLDGLKSLPDTPWVEELKAQPPAQLSPALQTVWQQWFFPVPPVEPTAEEKTLLSITDFSQLTPKLIPLVARFFLRRNAPDYIVKEFETFLRVRCEFPTSPFFAHSSTAPASTPPDGAERSQG